MTKEKEDDWKVIKIINDYNVVINAGKEDFLNIDDELEVFVKGEILVDPDTGNELGQLDYIKARLVVKDLFEKFSVCTNSDQRTTGLAGITSFTQTRTEPLSVDSSQISGYGLKANKIIQIGDLVRKSL